MPVGPFADLEKGCSECRGRPLGFDAAVATNYHEGHWRRLCLKLKSEREAWLAPWMAGLLADARATELALLPPDAWVVPVPLHWLRRLQRGYNQSDALAEALARRLGLETQRPVRRIKYTEHLVGTSLAKRAEIVRGAFEVDAWPGPRSEGPNHPPGRRRSDDRRHHRGRRPRPEARRGRARGRRRPVPSPLTPT